MKSFLIVIVVLLLCVVSFSQEKVVTKKYELGYKIPSVFYVTEYDYFSFLHLSFKYKLNDKNILRLGATYSKYSDGNYSRYFNSLYGGYERRTKQARFQFLYGAEIGYINIFTVFEENTGKPNVLFFGIGPVIGGVWNISNRFSIQSEANLMWGFARERDYYGDIFLRESVGVMFYWHSAISLGVFYRFGK